MRRRLVQAMARNRVAMTSTTRVAIGSHCDTIEVGVYVGRAIAMLVSMPEYRDGFEVYPTITQPWYDTLYLVGGFPGQLEPVPNMLPENQLGIVNVKVNVLILLPLCALPSTGHGERFWLTFAPEGQAPLTY